MKFPKLSEAEVTASFIPAGDPEFEPGHDQVLRVVVCVQTRFTVHTYDCIVVKDGRRYQALIPDDAKGAVLERYGIYPVSLLCVAAAQAQVHLLESRGVFVKAEDAGETIGLLSNSPIVSPADLFGDPQPQAEPDPFANPYTVPDRQEAHA